MSFSCFPQPAHIGTHALVELVPAGVGSWGTLFESAGPLAASAWYALASVSGGPALYLRGADRVPVWLKDEVRSGSVRIGLRCLGL